MARTKPIVLSCAGHTLSAEEKALFSRQRPAGLILFNRNIQTPEQVRGLIADFRDAVEDDNSLIMIDQEGGRVARLGPPHWRRLPPAGRFGEMAAGDFVEAAAALQLAASLLAADLKALGINVDCYPVLDVPQPGAHDIIGDRAFAADPTFVARLGRVAVDAMLSAGVLPVIKHIPGHGRAGVDSHESLPRVSADRETLEETDFAPFKALADAPMAMTAHVVFEAVDPSRPATTSGIVIDEVIRGDIGFEGILISDDITMGALEGTMGERSARARDAGCDLVLHCSGDLDEARHLLESTAGMGEELETRIAAALERIAEPEAVDIASAQDRLRQLLGDAA